MDLFPFLTHVNIPLDVLHFEGLMQNYCNYLILNNKLQCFLGFMSTWTTTTSFLDIIDWFLGFCVLVLHLSQHSETLSYDHILEILSMLVGWFLCCFKLWWVYIMTISTTKPAFLCSTVLAALTHNWDTDTSHTCGTTDPDFAQCLTMHRSANFQALPNPVDYLWSCEGVFLVCFLGQIVTWQYNHNLLKLTMYCYKWSWLTVGELSIVCKNCNPII